MKYNAYLKDAEYLDELLEVYDNLREMDRLEMNAMGIDRDNIHHLLYNCVELKIGYLNDKPIAIWGSIISGQVLNLIFVASKEIEKVWLTVNRMWKDYLKYFRNDPEYLGYRIIAYPLAEYEASCRWLCRIGFHYTGESLYYDGKKYYIMELE